MTTIEISVNDRIVNFCQGTNFKTYVRQAINDELFWRDWISKLNLSETIENKLNSKLPSQVRDQVEKIIPTIIETKIMNYIIQNFPSQVAREIQTQMPVFLNNNYQMQEILKKHKDELKDELETKTREILNRVVNDPNYHEVTSYHLAAIDAKGGDKIQEIDNKASDQRRTNQHVFDEQLAKMQTKVNNDLGNLKNSLDEVKTLKYTITNMQDKHNQEMSSIKWAIGGITGFFVLLTAMAACLRK